MDRLSFFPCSAERTQRVVMDAAIFHNVKQNLAYMPAQRTDPTLFRLVTGQPVAPEARFPILSGLTGALRAYELTDLSSRGLLCGSILNRGLR